MKQQKQFMRIILVLICVAQIFASTSVPPELQAKIQIPKGIHEIKFCEYNRCCVLNKKKRFYDPSLNHCPIYFRKHIPFACPAIYAPVLCLDGNVYSNCCVACSKGETVCIHVPLNFPFPKGP